MCGIIGAISYRNITPLLLEGLKRLEYRGYDSAGIAVLFNGEIQRVRVEGKVDKLIQILTDKPLEAYTGIAHTRWATHGIPSETNAHPHMSGIDMALVHNGIIENYDQLDDQLEKDGYQFDSETDTEVIVHAAHKYLQKTRDLLTAVQKANQDLEGTYAVAMIHKNEPKRIIAARNGSPLVIGLGTKENFVASDVLALLPVTQQFIYLEEGDVADIREHSVKIYNKKGELVERNIQVSSLTSNVISRGEYRHYMLKEIHEQPVAINETLEGRLTDQGVNPGIFGTLAKELFPTINRVEIVACGTSYHAGLVGRHFIESLVGIPCQVEVASEYRYRQNVVEPNTLFVTLSQSGETADTLAALRKAKDLKNYTCNLAICNVPESTLVREADLVFLTRAGVEIGVASTKAFTTQLVSLLLLTLALGPDHHMNQKTIKTIVEQLRQTSRFVEAGLALDDSIMQLARLFQDKHHALFLGRGLHYPVAMEGALKLKEISYIHAEAYPAGELKHGPLALIDNEMPVVSVAPNDELLEKLKNNLNEVSARGGKLIVFADKKTGFDKNDNISLLTLPAVGQYAAPIVYTIPLQLLAYHVAVLKGTDVDQPRNLAKSVTVE